MAAPYRETPEKPHVPDFMAAIESLARTVERAQIANSKHNALMLEKLDALTVKCREMEEMVGSKCDELGAVVKSVGKKSVKKEDLADLEKLVHRMDFDAIGGDKNKGIPEDDEEEEGEADPEESEDEGDLDEDEADSEESEDGE